MPVTPEEINITQNNFYAVAAFPRVIGTIDCTHIRIQSPGKKKNTFQCRKNSKM